jgi:lysophospholipase L1-like esterase
MKLRQIGLLALWSVGLVVAAELFQRAIEPDPNRYFTFPPNTEFSLTIDPAILPGVSPVGSFKVNALGLRGREPADEPARILVLGGSTVENIVQSETNVWTAKLDARIAQAAGQGAVWVGNAGRSGITSFENLIQLRHLDDIVPKVKTAIVLIGFNDMAYGLRNANRDEREEVSEAERYQRTFFVVQGDKRAFPRNLALYRLFVSVRRWANFALRGETPVGGFRPDPDGYMRWLVETRRDQMAASPQVETPPDLAPFLRQFRDNLAEMAALAARKGVDLILVTQPVAFRPNQSEALRGTYGWSGLVDVPLKDGSRRRFYYSPGALHAMMSLYNATTLQACVDLRLTCIDLTDKLAPDAAHFYDGLHLTDLGNAAVADAVFEGLRDSDRLRPPRR